MMITEENADSISEYAALIVAHKKIPTSEFHVYVESILGKFKAVSSPILGSVLDDGCVIPVNKFEELQSEYINLLHDYYSQAATKFEKHGIEIPDIDYARLKELRDKLA